MLRIQGIQKKRGDHFLLGPIDLSFDMGRNTVIFGRNGAGKSTFFELVTGQTDSDEGFVFLNEKKISPQNYELRKAIGYLPQEFKLPPWVTPEEILLYAAHLHELVNPRKLVDERLDYWGCHEFRRRPLIHCSYGMQKRVALALAELHSPSVLILDEPLNGLDIEYAASLEERIRLRRAMNLLTILSVHSPHFAAKNCDQAWMMDKGQLRVMENWEGSSLLDRIEHIERLFS